MDRELIYFELPTSSVHIKTIGAYPDINYRGLHSHSCIELVRVNCGTISCYINEKEITLASGNIIFINHRVIHQLKLHSDSSITYIQADTEKYIHLLKSSGFDSFSEENCIMEFITQPLMNQYWISYGEDELSHLFNHIEREITERNAYFETYIKSYIFQLVAFMYRFNLLSDTYPTLHNISKILPITQFIGKNYNSKLSLDKISSIIDCDNFQLCKLFKKVTGRTVVDYINFVRLRKAEELLANTKKNISEIAYECGFSSIQYFNKVFKKYHGCPPSVYTKGTLREIK